MRAREFFLGKRIAVVGLGPRGEMISDIKFLVRSNALVSVYDLKTEARLGPLMPSLRSLGLANCICGSVPPDDLLDMDLIILSHEYPKASSFLADARKKGIEIEYPETLFLRLAPPVTVIGILGSCGKTTVLSMLGPMMEAASAAEGGQSSWMIDYGSGDGVLAQLKTMKSGDTVAMRIEERMMKDIQALKWSPQVAIFASMPTTAAYAETAFEMLQHQTYNNYVIGSDNVIDAIRSGTTPVKAKMLRTKGSLIPDEWGLDLRPPHMRENAALAVQAAKLLKASDEACRSALAARKPLKNRLETVKKVKGVEFVNDSASVSPLATLAAIGGSSGDKNMVVIIGGADEGADYRELYAALPRYAHTLVVIPGSGTLKERSALRRVDGMPVLSVHSVEEAVRTAFDHARKGDKVLFSPAFDACGTDACRIGRGERFARAVRSL